MSESLRKIEKCPGRRGQFLLLPLLLLCLLPARSIAENGVYFWHRGRNEATDRVLASCSGLRIYALRGEFRQGVPPVLLRPPAAPSIPVFRLDARIWEQEDFTESFARILRAETAPEIQLDCDVPESRLRQYDAFLKELRRRVPGKRFSATLLPCHLRHPTELKRLLRQLSSYVLQLHALEKPADLPEAYQLFDPVAAARAVEQALELGKPFQIALPVYAYRLHYEAKTGRFRRLSAENRPPRAPGELVRIAAPDWRELLRFRKKFARIPVIWFRLPMPGDRLCLELENLRRLDAGLPPREEITTSTRRAGARTELYWTNHGIPGEPEFTQVLGGGSGEAFFFHGVHPAEPAVPGCVPEAIRGPVPGPGETLKIGEIIQWIPTASN